ncbi:hypothetical protein LMG29542_08527 [Paraburkholderia humisilvae]|uniref:Fis family transcriptional regulator n=2 Tax=Paraburkholderia humisilvae TaxID=627669 RepID=A0A6J5FD41_9BURK|nr:hypothetical protein LMG29542_08527 [Paraburkholderia humisilvae]
MPVSKRSTRSRGTPQPHRTRRLFLPLARSDAEKVILRCRLEFEAIRQGRADRANLDQMASTLLLIRYLTEAGHGLLPLPFFYETELMLFDAMEVYMRDGTPVVPGPLVERLVAAVNEYDRQLRETRLQAVIDASRKLDAYIARIKASLAERTSSAEPDPEETDAGD